MWLPAGKGAVGMGRADTEWVNDRPLHRAESRIQYPARPQWRRVSDVQQRQAAWRVTCTSIRRIKWGFPGGSVVKNLPASAGDLGLIPDLRKSHVPQSNSTRVPK